MLLSWLKYHRSSRGQALASPRPRWPRRGVTLFLEPLETRMLAIAEESQAAASENAARQASSHAAYGRTGSTNQ